MHVLYMCKHAQDKTYDKQNMQNKTQKTKMYRRISVHACEIMHMLYMCKHAQTNKTQKRGQSTHAKHTRV